MHHLFSHHQFDSGSRSNGVVALIQKKLVFVKFETKLQLKLLNTEQQGHSIVLCLATGIPFTVRTLRRRII